MGAYARYPIALAPGMGLNAYFTYTVVKGMGVPWQTAFGSRLSLGRFFPDSHADRLETGNYFRDSSGTVFRGGSRRRAVYRVHRPAQRRLDCPGSGHNSRARKSARSEHAACDLRPAVDFTSSRLGRPRGNADRHFRRDVSWGSRRPGSLAPADLPARRIARGDSAASWIFSLDAKTRSGRNRIRVPVRGSFRQHWYPGRRGQESASLCR